MGVSGEVEDDVGHNLRHLIHEIHFEKLFSTEEIISLVVCLFSDVREEGSSRDDWLDVGKFSANFHSLTLIIL